MVVLSFTLILAVPFVLACAAMALPVPYLLKSLIAISPLAIFALAIADHFFWIGDIGGFVIAFIATWSWLLGVGLGRDVRSATRFVVRLARH